MLWNILNPSLDPWSDWICRSWDSVSVNTQSLNISQARIDALLQSKENLISDLSRIYAAKQKTLSLQIDAVELELGKISGCCDFADNVLKFGNEVEVLQIKSRLQELNSISINLDPEEDDSIQYIRCVGSSSYHGFIQGVYLPFITVVPHFRWVPHFLDFQIRSRLYKSGTKYLVPPFEREGAETMSYSRIFSRWNHDDPVMIGHWNGFNFLNILA